MTAERRGNGVCTAELKNCLLIVEDDADQRDLLLEFFQEEGYRVAGAANGRDALAYLQGAAPPRLILLDPMTPVMNGWELRRQLRQDPQLAAIPVAVVTGVRGSVDQIAALDAVGCFQKPVDLGALLATVEQYC